MRGRLLSSSFSSFPPPPPPSAPPPLLPPPPSLLLLPLFLLQLLPFISHVEHRPSTNSRQTLSCCNIWQLPPPSPSLPATKPLIVVRRLFSSFTFSSSCFLHALSSVVVNGSSNHDFCHQLYYCFWRLVETLACIHMSFPSIEPGSLTLCPFVTCSSPTFAASSSRSGSTPPPSQAAASSGRLLTTWIRVDSPQNMCSFVSACLSISWNILLVFCVLLVPSLLNMQVYVEKRFFSFFFFLCNSRSDIYLSV